MTQKLLNFTINRLTEKFTETNRLRLQAAQQLKNHRFKSNSLDSTPLLINIIRTFSSSIRTYNPLSFFDRDKRRSGKRENKEEERKKRERPRRRIKEKRLQKETKKEGEE